MSANTFTVADQILLSSWGIADADAPRPRSPWATERVLEAAADGSLTGPDLADPVDELPIRLDGREVTEPEARAVTNLLVEGNLAWCGGRITLTTAGRELLDRWARYQRMGGEQG